MVFGLVFALMLSVLAFGLVIYGKLYLKEKRQVITIRKLTIIALFFSIFIGQSYLTLLMGLTPVIPFSLDNLTIIAVSFIFGPIEGIIYAFVADATRVFINGWAFQILPIFIFPLTALLAGGIGRWYKNGGKDFSKRQGFILTQIVLATMVVVSFGAVAGSEIIGGVDTTDVFYITVIVITVISIVVLEIILYFFFKNSSKKQNDENVKLFVALFMVNVISRISMGWFVRSYAQYIYWGYPFAIEILKRMITSSYLIPIWTSLSYALIKASLFAMKQTKNPNSW